MIMSICIVIAMVVGILTARDPKYKTWEGRSGRPMPMPWATDTQALKAWRCLCKAQQRYQSISPVHGTDWMSGWDIDTECLYFNTPDHSTHMEYYNKESTLRRLQSM